MLQPPNVLLLFSEETEIDSLQTALSEHVTLTLARNLNELRKLLEGGSYDALFCAWSFHLGIWSEVLDEVRQRDSDLPVIIFSRTAGEREWIQVLEAGAMDLLVPPYQQKHLLSVLTHASESREARAWINIGPGSEKKAS